MPFPPRLFAGAEEMGKKDDDHRPSTRSSKGFVVQHWRLPHGPYRRTMRRLALGIIALIGLYYFYKNIPIDLESPRQRPHYDHSTGRPSTTTGASPNHGSMLTPNHDENTGSGHYFNGPIKFYQLASSLRAATKSNWNVLFAAASLKSASMLLPIACDMALKETNIVHFAMMGREDISIELFKIINGISDDCKISFHDARPDFPTHSSDFRMEVSCSAAFNHLNTYVEPQATIVDGTDREELFFMNGLRDRSNLLGRTLIELPENSEQNLMWISQLDSASLSAWNKASVDILVHAPPASSGSLIRLLESLKKADYFSSPPPRLTIELPNEIDEPTKRYLETFKWPPNQDQNAGSLLTLHHRIPQHRLTAEENSIRFLESFWPADPSKSHVLVLSPLAELSPLFFHYLKYTMLQYRYSSAKAESHKNLLSISLDVPSTYLNDSTSFIPPVGNYSVSDEDISSGDTQFLWQAPNSNAALYFGEKWVELHDFVARLLKAQRSLPSTALKVKLVSKTYPSWLEHILKLARLRGYWSIYPGLKIPQSLATLHQELYQLPEEYAGTKKKKPPAIKGNTVLTDVTPGQRSLIHDNKPLVFTPLLNILPFDGSLPKIWDIPLLTWDGNRIILDEIEDHALAYSRLFRHEIGGCDISAKEKPRVELSAKDLFCLVDKE